MIKVIISAPPSAVVVSILVRDERTRRAGIAFVHVKKGKLLSRQLRQLFPNDA
jgi:hypothetical protein